MLTRRDFLEITVAGAVAAHVEPARAQGEMPYRTLGKTGEKVSLLGLGGAHTGRQKDVAESIRIIRTALDNGVNFLDNCWDYNDGQSEIRMGKALADGYRRKAFLMTKIDGRDRATAAQQIDESLKRLQTDHLDLLQIHEVIRDNDPDRIFSAGGAAEAMLAAKKAGKARYLGFTGHKSPAIHLKMVKAAAAHAFPLDTVQMPLNVMDAHFNSFEQQVLPELVRQKIGVLSMKSLGDHFILDTKLVTAEECWHYAMNLPISVMITGIDSLDVLEAALAAARSFKPMTGEQVAALRARTATAAAAGAHERYKTTGRFDGTAHHPEWLGPGGEMTG
jgi:aryl-alcohol dehydrogenase-like predicted oxidoreductase